MKPPESVEVAGVAIGIDYFPPSFGDDDCGQYEEKTNAIHLAKGLSPDMERTTLLHELTHAVIFVAGLRDDLKEKDSEERFCNLFALLLHDLLRKNPRFVRYITS